MPLYNKLRELVVLPASDLFLGQSIYKKLRFLMKSQWWSRGEIENYQNQMLRGLIKHSYENVPYYSELFKKYKLTPTDIKKKEDLYKVPILTKEDIRRNFPHKITAKNINSSNFIFNTSSGSTGEPLQFYNSKENASFNKAAGIRAWYWMGYKLGDKYIKISSHVRNSKLKRIQDALNNCSYQYSEHLTQEIFNKIVDNIEKYDPKFIRGYPLLLEYLSDVLKNKKEIELSNLKAVSSTGSTLYPKMIHKIEETFDAYIYDSYSCEGGAIFAQCEDRKNYHPSEEYAISEFLDDDYSKNDGAKRHITTDLFNYVNPFIRYDTQDYIVLGNEEKCGCGRNLMNIAKIKGRDGDILALPNGRYLIEENFFQYFDLSNFIDKFQVYQEKSELIHIKVVANDNFNKALKKELYDYWKDYLGDGVELNLSVVNEIRVGSNGKRRFVIRNPKIKL